MFNVQTEPTEIVVRNTSVCVFCTLSAIDYNDYYYPFKVIVFPGERFPLSIIAYDVYNNTVGVAVILYDSQVITDNY